jgi:hypothetical protein
MRTLVPRLALAPAMALASLASLGCDDDAASPDAGSAPMVSASVSAPTSTSGEKPTGDTSAAPAQKPKALDPAGLEKSLRCGGQGPCEVLAGFESCEPWSPITQSGDGRWLGYGYVVDKGKQERDWVVVRTRRVALDDVPAGQLPAKLTVTTIPTELEAARSHAAKAIRAFERGDVPTETNAAIRYIKRRKDWQESFTLQAEQNQVYGVIGGGAYLCHHKDLRLFLVKLDGNSAHRGDGVYAILWPVSW